MLDYLVGQPYRIHNFGFLAIPALRRNPEGIHAYFSTATDWQRRFALFALFAGLAFISFQLHSPKIHHLKHLCKHPPIWFAWLIACFVLGYIDLAIGIGPTDFQPAFWDWAFYCGGSITLVVLWRFLSSTPEDVSKPLPFSGVESVKDLLSDWPTLENWLNSEKPTCDDLLGNRRIATRLAKYLIEEGGTVGLVGQFGCGKTSVISWLKEDVENAHSAGKTRILFAEQSCWGFEDSASAVQQILSKALLAVGRKADCFSLRALPESYRKTFSAGGDWLRTFVDLIIGTSDPLEQFRHLSDILKRIDSRLVIIVEDLDRNTSSRFDRQEILALLLRLRISDRLSFVLASGQTSARDIDFAKLCDHIEIFQAIGEDKVSALVRGVRNQCLSLFLFPHISMISSNDNPWDHSRSILMNRHDCVSLSDATTRLLRTPRALKHALRRTYKAWETLIGEVDFDHLLAVNLLRYGSPEAFDFLLRHWDRLHDDYQTWGYDQSQLPQIKAMLTTEWRQVTEKVDWNLRSGLEILKFVLPAAGEYLGDRRGNEHLRKQGISHERYWLRIINEDIDPSHARDQSVLRDLDCWMADPSDTSSSLLAGLCTCDDYVRVWEHLAPRILYQNSALVLMLAGQIISRHGSVHGMRNTSPNAIREVVFPERAFDALRRYVNSHVPKDDSTRDWLANQIRIAMPVSLSLVNDLCYDWGSIQCGILRKEDKDCIRHIVHKLAKAHLKTGGDLIRITHPGITHTIYQLVFPPGSENQHSVLRGLEHWDWLGPILLDALEKEPTRFACEIASLISEHSIDGYDKNKITLNHELFNGFFKDSATEVMHHLAKARDTSIGLDCERLCQVVGAWNNADLSSEAT